MSLFLHAFLADRAARSLNWERKGAYAILLDLATPCDSSRSPSELCTSLQSYSDRVGHSSQQCQNERSHRLTPVCLFHLGLLVSQLSTAASSSFLLIPPWPHPSPGLLPSTASWCGCTPPLRPPAGRTRPLPTTCCSPSDSLHPTSATHLDIAEASGPSSHILMTARMRRSSPSCASSRERLPVAPRIPSEHPPP